MSGDPSTPWLGLDSFKDQESKFLIEMYKQYGRKVMILDPQLLAEIFKHVVIELFSIIRDEDSRDAKATNHIFLDETINIPPRDGSQGFGLDPLGEIINSYDKEFDLTHCHEEMSHYVEPPLN